MSDGYTRKSSIVDDTPDGITPSSTSSIDTNLLQGDQTSTNISEILRSEFV